MHSLLVLVVLAALLIGAYKAGITCSNSDAVFGGVCGGLAQHYNLAPNLTRVLAVIAALITGGFAILLYIGLWISLPKR
ncbi:MAG: PspC domain-containing protein [Cyanobacteria bacterium SZAS LIN-2]|nr:PspC domain-containing protein [Cyanobacteria bacterium SZAS LIN-3]MBS1997140.1 PspC domain-containing protein [Cyanobacteria bacterium SZAS LIN-2]MBS2007376.1 PspC domain-containing protein [Cyanobacteria bacterium SZAS TMP-1]